MAAVGRAAEGRAVNPATQKKFRGEVQSNNSIAGKLQDGDMIFNLKGQYDPGTKAFTMQAASSAIVFSISGKLTNSGNIGSSHATVEVKGADNEWTTIVLQVASSNQSVNGAANQTGGVSTPTWSRGTWYDWLTDSKIIVTENSITVIDAWMGEVQPLTIVELQNVDANSARLLIRGITLGSPISYNARVYVSNALNPTHTTAYGSTTLEDLITGGGGTTLAVAAAGVNALPGDKMFVSPYCSPSGAGVIVDDELKSTDNYYPMFETSAAARSAANLRAVFSFTQALKRTRNPQFN